MQEPDARLGRIDSTATSEAINSIGNIQNAINAGVNNQLNIISNYQKAKADKEALDLQEENKKELARWNLENAQKERDQQLAIHKQEDKTRRYKIAMDRAMQTDAQNFEANRPIIHLLQAQGGNIRNKLYSYKDKNNKPVYGQKVGNNTFYSFKNEIPINAVNEHLPLQRD